MDGHQDPVADRFVRDPLSGAVTLHDPDCSTDFAARTGIQHMNLVFGHRSSVAQQICNNPSCAMASKDSRFSR
jgi:hypothetical protein